MRVAVLLVVVTTVVGAVFTPVVAADDDDLVDVGGDDGPGASADGSTSADSSGGSASGETEYRGSNGSNRTVEGDVAAGEDGASVFAAANRTSEAGFRSGTIARCEAPADPSEACNVTRFDESPPEPEPPGERNASVEDVHVDAGPDGAAAGANVTGSDNDEGPRTIAGFDCDTESAQVCTLYALGNGSQGPDVGGGAPSASVEDVTVNFNESSGLYANAQGSVTADNESTELGASCQVNENSSAEDCSTTAPGGNPPDSGDLPGGGDGGDDGPSTPDVPGSPEDVEAIVDWLTPVDRHLPL